MGRLYGLELDYNYRLSNSANYGGKRNLDTIKYIVIHYTGNNGDTDTGNGAYFSRTKVGAGAHYFVDDDSCTQSIPDNRIAYHCETKGMKLKCGCRNYNSIGIEMCSDIIKGKYVITEKTRENTVKLTKYIMKKYNISEENVIRHFDVCGKICPEPWVRNADEWLKFKKMLKEDEEVITQGTMTVNGKDIKIDKIVKDGRTFVSVRNFEAAGFKVNYNADTKNISVDNDIKKLSIDFDGNIIMADSVNIGGYNFCPLRTIADIGGYNVFYDKGVKIRKNKV